MRLYIDKATQQLVPGPNLPGAVGGSASPLRFMLGTSTSLELQFLDGKSPNQVPVRLPEGTQAWWNLKRELQFEGLAVIAVSLDVLFTRPASDDGFYTAELDCDTVEAHTALQTPDGILTNDIPYISLAGEINFKRPDQLKPNKTGHVYATLQNCYTQGTEGTPASANPALGTRVGSFFHFSGVTTYTGGVSGCLDAVPTATLGVPQLALFVVPGQGARFYQLSAGVEATDMASFGTIRPADFNATTNAKVWKSVL